MTRSSAGSRHGAAETSPAARNLAEWFRQLDRLVRMARTYGVRATLVVQQRSRVVEGLAEVVAYHAPLVLRCSAVEIYLRDELVVRSPHTGDESDGVPIERRLPFLLYRDGVRGCTLPAGTRTSDLESLVDGIISVAAATANDHDLVTLLWEADLCEIRIDAATLDQTLDLRVARANGPEPLHPAESTRIWRAPEPSLLGEAPASQRPGAEVIAGWCADWDAAFPAVDPALAWHELASGEREAREAFMQFFHTEREEPWTRQVAGLVAHVLRLDGGDATREALCSTLVTWLADAVQRCEWDEAWTAYDAILAADPALAWAPGLLTQVLSGLDAQAIAERLEESDPAAAARFFAITVKLGSPSLDLVVSVMSRATRARLRAAATTALSYTCGDEPTMLAPYLRDSRWHVVRNIVFVLGQIGGREAADLLAQASRHLDARVRRAVISALGQVPSERRLPLLIAQLEGADPATLPGVLAMLTRERDPRIAQALLRQIGAIDFETRPEDVKLALLAALGDVADDEAVPALEALLQKGGWFARRTPERSGAARTLARIGSPLALKVLHAGSHSRAEAVRSACLEALALREAA